MYRDLFAMKNLIDKDEIMLGAPSALSELGIAEVRDRRLTKFDRDRGMNFDF